MLKLHHDAPVIYGIAKPTFSDENNTEGALLLDRKLLFPTFHPSIEERSK
jgi:hypothetical protein